MATIIDALLVTLKLDTSGYKAGANEASAAGKRMVSTQNEVTKKITESSKKAADAQIAQVKQQEAAAKKLAEQYGKVKLELLDMAAGTLAATGLGKMIGSTVSGLSQLQTQSQLLGYSANELKKWQNVMTTLGGDPAEFNQFAARIAKFRSDVKLGRQDAADATFQAGLQMAGVSNKALMEGSFREIFEQIAGALKGQSNADIANILGNTPALGFGSGMIQLVQSGAEGIAKSYHDAAGANDEAAKDAKDLSKAYTDLTTKIGTSLQNFPGFDAAMKGATKGLEALGDFATEHPTGTAVGMGGATVAGGIGAWLLSRSALAKFARMFAGAGVEAGAAGATGAAGAGTAAAAAAGEGATAATGAAAAGGSAALRWLGPVGALIYGLTHSENLNTGEAEQIKKIRAAEQATGGKWPGDTRQAAQVSKDPSGKLSDAATAQQTASKALVDAAREFANAISTNAKAAEISVGGSLTGIGGRVRDWANKLDFSGLERQHGLPAGLLSSLAQQESGGDASARSKAGAAGLFQFMPATAREYGINAMDPAQSARAAARKMAGLMKHYGGNLSMALSAYNWGEGNLDRKGMAAAPGETQAYAPAIMRRMGLGSGASLAPMYAAAARSQAGGATTNHNSSETHIGAINVYGADPNNAQSVASGIREEASRSALIMSSAIPVT
ncbi:lytic transglycosylase domain-containing protein [Paraburkholderia youngii]|uniref:lytic transglycosylase domain-containing protein n=1 Tax=Paraburkholderia youngii TaxID=2782701 RepID=UPI003D255F7F